jgi:hypothetical protein
MDAFGSRRFSSLSSLRIVFGEISRSKKSMIRHAMLIVTPCPLSQPRGNHWPAQID